MQVLIVDRVAPRSEVWGRSLRTMGASVTTVSTEEAAIAELDRASWSVLIVNAGLAGGGCLVVADYARFRQPDAKVIVVTDGGLFSDGRIFELLPNACACIPGGTDAGDLTALVDFHGMPRQGAELH